MQTEELLRRDAEHRLVRETFDNDYLVLECVSPRFNDLSESPSDPERGCVDKSQDPPMETS